jgi:MFS family permease
MAKIELSTTTRRLMPLYAAAFFLGIPFWYAIEKIFMIGIGFNTASIGVMVVVMSVVMLAVETPSGILADRWSRKGVMILGCLALLVSGVVGAISFNEPMYILSTVFWGIYAALYSGTYDSVIYDTVVEENGDSKNFEKYLGRFKAIEGASFVIGALAGGFIASQIGIRDAYIFSLPLIALAFIFLWKFKEPTLHKAEVAQPVFKHIRQTFAAVLRNPVLLPVVIATVGFLVLQESIFELSQLWFIAVAAPIALYGVFSAAVFSSWTTGGLIAARIRSKPAIIALMVILIAMIMLLALGRHFAIVLVSQFVIAICLVAISVILAKKMHDELPSRLRAGSSSVVSTLARVVLIPSTLVITGIANSHDIFTATYVLLGIAIISVIAFMSITSVKKQSK